MNIFDFHIIFNSYTKTEMLYSVYTQVACLILCYSFSSSYYLLLLFLLPVAYLFQLTSFSFILNFNPSLSCEQLQPNSSWSLCCYCVIKRIILLRFLPFSVPFSCLQTKMWGHCSFAPGIQYPFSIFLISFIHLFIFNSGGVGDTHFEVMPMWHNRQSCQL